MANDQTSTVGNVAPGTGGLVNVYGQGVQTNSTTPDPMQSYVSNVGNAPVTPYNTNTPNPVTNSGVVTQTTSGSVLDATSVSRSAPLGNISTQSVPQENLVNTVFQAVAPQGSQNINAQPVPQNTVQANPQVMAYAPAPMTTSDVNIPSTSDNTEHKDESESKEELTPLQALAKKLSDLKSQFITDDEDTTKSEEEKDEDTTQPVASIPQNFAEIKNALEKREETPPVSMSLSDLTKNISNGVLTKGVGDETPVPVPEPTPAPVSTTTTTTTTTTPITVSVPTPVPTATQAPAPVAMNTAMPDFLTDSLNSSEKAPDSKASPESNTAEKEVVGNKDLAEETQENGTEATETVSEEEEEAPVPITEIPGISASDTWVTKPEQQPSLIGVIPVDNQHGGNISKLKNKRYSYSIDQLLDIVVERNGSDLHIQTGYPAMVRVDGSLLPVSKDIVTPENIAELILPVMDEEKRDRLEVNREVDLAFAHGDKARFRINAFHQKQTMAAAFRLIPSKIKSLADLQLPPIYNELAKMHQGLVLVTGPTGHGKSTTLAAIIQEINNTRDAHILTIEDPIEYIFPVSRALIAQREIQDDTHSWDIALKSALREDPDVILVGEMRDYETIAAVITLAETGHLVFATLHTNSAAQTVDRIIDVFPENQQSQVRAQLANVVEAVIAQRLIPLDKGGRKAASEIMLVNPAVRTLIREGKTHQLDNVIRTSADQGMVSLESSLIKLVRDNEITMEKAMRYSLRPEEIVRLLKG